MKFTQWSIPYRFYNSFSTVQGKTKRLKNTPLCKLHKVSKVLLANAMFLITSLAGNVFVLINQHGRGDVNGKLINNND